MTVLAKGAPWPAMGDQWIRQEPREPEIRESTRIEMPPTRAQIMRDWLAEHPWSTGTEIANGSGLCIKYVNRAMRTQVEYGHAVVEMRYNEVGFCMVKKHYKLTDKAVRVMN